MLRGRLEVVWRGKRVATRLEVCRGSSKFAEVGFVGELETLVRVVASDGGSARGRCDVGRIGRRPIVVDVAIVEAARVVVGAAGRVVVGVGVGDGVTVVAGAGAVIGALVELCACSCAEYH